LLSSDQINKFGQKKEDKMSEEEKLEVTFVKYDWDALDWDKEKSEEKEQTKSAAARDLLEALEEQQIVDEIEIKQEIVLDPNE
jgi:hypothetical protein